MDPEDPTSNMSNRVLTPPQKILSGTRADCWSPTSSQGDLNVASSAKDQSMDDLDDIPYAEEETVDNSDNEHMDMNIIVADLTTHGEAGDDKDSIPSPSREPNRPTLRSRENQKRYTFSQADFEQAATVEPNSWTGSLPQPKARVRARSASSGRVGYGEAVYVGGEILELPKHLLHQINNCILEEGNLPLPFSLWRPSRRVLEFGDGTPARFVTSEGDMLNVGVFMFKSHGETHCIFIVKAGEGSGWEAGTEVIVTGKASTQGRWAIWRGQSKISDIDDEDICVVRERVLEKGNSNSKKDQKKHATFSKVKDTAFYNGQGASNIHLPRTSNRTSPTRNLKRKAAKMDLTDSPLASPPNWFAPAPVPASAPGSKTAPSYKDPMVSFIGQDGKIKREREYSKCKSVNMLFGQARVAGVAQASTVFLTVKVNGIEIHVFRDDDDDMGHVRQAVENAMARAEDVNIRVKSADWVE